MGPFDESFGACHDLDFWLRLALLRSQSIACVPDFLTYYRQRRGQLTKNVKLMEDSWNQLLEKMRGIAPRQTALVASRAASNMSRYFAYLFHENGDYQRAQTYLMRSFRQAPLHFICDARSWKMLAANVAALVLPGSWYRLLRGAALRGESAYSGKSCSETVGMRKSGIYDLAINGGGGAEKRSVVIAERLSRKHDVWLIVGESCSFQHLQDYFGVDLTQVKVLQLQMPLDRGLRRLLQTENGTRFGSAAVDAMIFNLRRDLDRTYFPQIQSLGLDLFINNQGGSNLRCPAPYGIYMCMFPHPLRSYRIQHHDGNVLYRTYSYLFHSVFGLSSRVLDSYQVITANSCDLRLNGRANSGPVTQSSFIPLPKTWARPAPRKT